jgi:hypothetical protein
MGNIYAALWGSALLASNDTPDHPRPVRWCQRLDGASFSSACAAPLSRYFEEEPAFMRGADFYRYATLHGAASRMQTQRSACRILIENVELKGYFYLTSEAIIVLRERPEMTFSQGEVKKGKEKNQINHSNSTNTDFSSGTAGLQRFTF